MYLAVLSAVLGQHATNKTKISRKRPIRYVQNIRQWQDRVRNYIIIPLHMEMRLTKKYFSQEFQYHKNKTLTNNCLPVLIEQVITRLLRSIQCLITRVCYTRNIFVYSVIRPHIFRPADVDSRLTARNYYDLLSYCLYLQLLASYGTAAICQIWRKMKPVHHEKKCFILRFLASDDKYS